MRKAYTMYKMLDNGNQYNCDEHTYKIYYSWPTNS